MGKHRPTVREIIIARATLAGYGEVPKLSKKTGITKSTFYRKLNEGGWTLGEISAIDKVVHFTDDDIKILFGRA